MYIRKLVDQKELIAGDKTILKELLNPEQDALDTNYSLAHAVLKTNTASLPHKLKSSEVYYILAGEGIMYIDNETEKVSAGHVIYIPPNATQYIKNTGVDVLKFLCIVEPAWRLEDEEIL